MFQDSMELYNAITFVVRSMPKLGLLEVPGIYVNVWRIPKKPDQIQ